MHLTHKLTALIADDSSLIRERLFELLSAFEGIDTIELARDTSEAKDKIVRLKPDIVILDIRMPGGGGFEVLKTIKEKNLKSRVVVLTSYLYPQYRDKSLELGADYFLSKETDIKKLGKILSVMFLKYEKTNS